MVWIFKNSIHRYLLPSLISNFKLSKIKLLIDHKIVGMSDPTGYEMRPKALLSTLYITKEKNKA
jgi:hypothetical protein